MSAPWHLGGYHGRTSVELMQGDQLIGTMTVRRLTTDGTVKYETEELAEGWARARVAAAAPELVDLIRDALPILDVLIEDREEVIGEEDEVSRDLRDRFRAALAKARAS